MMKRKLLWKRKETGEMQRFLAFLDKSQSAAGKEEDMKKFLKYVVPSVLAFALSGIYAIVDGFFVGNSVGDVGLSAINVVYPVVTLMQSAGTGIGMGGAVIVDFEYGRAEGQKEDGDEYVRTALRLLLLTSIVLTAVDADLYGSGAVLSGGRGDDSSPG